MRTSPPAERGRILAQPLHLVVQQGGPPATKTVIAASNHLLPLFPVAPPLRVDGGPCRPGAGQEHPSSCLPVCPAMGAEGQASRLVGTYLSSIPASSPLSSEAPPPWGSIVQDVVCTSFPPLLAVTMQMQVSHTSRAMRGDWA